MPESGDASDLDQIQVLDGSTFMISDSRGDVEFGSLAGLFHEDTRFLNRFSLTVGGVAPTLLTSSEVDFYSAAFFLTNPELPGLPDRSLSIQRQRFVGAGLQERITVRNHLTQPVQVELKVSCHADFADLFEVKQKEFRKGGSTRKEHDDGRGLLVFEYEHHEFEAGTMVRSTKPGRIDEDALVFDFQLGPREVWETTIKVFVHSHGQRMEPFREEFEGTERSASRVLKKWQDEVPRLLSASDLLVHVYNKSIIDLAALRLHAEVEGNDYSLPAAGLPWFMAIFGRDTLVTSFQALLVGPDLARGALHALAALQGKESNDFKDEDPGKILHEIRFGELTALGLKPHRPYYGTADATPLFLILLSEYWRMTGDGDCVKELRGNAMRALKWIDKYGDFDGDGYIEYKTRSKQGLRNQGWKDSWNAVLFHDGTVADPPIALCEIQGYAYDAKMRCAELAEKVWGEPDLAERLRKEASALYDRFNADYWVEDRAFYAIALAGEPGHKRVVDSITSNMGHLLWSGIVPEDRAKRVVEHLMSPAMFSGWGVRTLSEENFGYNPIAYHDGTVWPHDNSIIAAGLARYGYRDEANRVALALLEAAEFTDFRLPEVFAGYPREEARFPVRYPTACSPQAWATGAPFLLLRTMLGLHAEDGKMIVDPYVPEELGEVFYNGFHAFDEHFDVRAKGSKGEVTPTA